MLIISRLLSPGSERHTKTWAEKISALDELMGCDFSQLFLNTLYKTMDSLYKHKEKIEEHLNQREWALFGLEEKIILYCKSELKAKKEGAIQSRLEQFFEKGLEQIKSSLNKKGGTKK